MCGSSTLTVAGPQRPWVIEEPTYWRHNFLGPLVMLSTYGSDVPLASVTAYLEALQRQFRFHL